MEPSAYYLSDPLFYDAPTAGTDPEWDRAAPDGWTRAENRDWLMYRADGAQLPLQGWKVHASACHDNAADILEALWSSCTDRRIPFKFIRGRHLLFLRNMKAADRSASGKFATMYPADETELEALLTELGARVRGQPGPYILSDLRWGDGPLYVRYGGFIERSCLGPSGELLPAVADDDGKLVPDRRGTSFAVPPWVTLPTFLVPHLDARSRASVEDLPYRIERALHFSNGGGVYAGIDRRTGEPVVLKEARPYAGLSEPDVDAVTRNRREERVLALLAGLAVVPAQRDSFTLGDHHFLVQDHVEGTSLAALISERYPLTDHEPDQQSIADYTMWALGILERVERAVGAVHGRGIVIGDLNPSNILVGPDGEVTLVDWEVAAPATEDPRPSLAAPGFAAPRSLSGFEIDRYALACLRLHVFLPLTRLVALDAGKADELTAAIAERFPVPASYLAEAVGIIAAGRTSSSRDARPKRPPPLDVDSAGWRRARDSMACAIFARSSPDRDDRLFPGGIQQFAGAGGIDLAHGAAGVLYALDATGAGRFPMGEDWLARRALHAPAGTPLGFYNGLHGIAYVLDRIQRPDEARRVLERGIDGFDDARPTLGLDLHGGLAGIALNLAHFAVMADDAALWDLVWKLADEVAARVLDGSPIEDVSGGEHPYAGLMRGSSGPALLSIRLFERTQDAGLLDVAATALRRDLHRCVEVRDTLHVNEGWRTMPYLGDGTAGIGIVLAEYLSHREDEEFADAVGAIRRAAAPQFCVASGLMAGRAGLLLALGHRAGPGAATSDPVVAAQLRLLTLHALSYEGHLAFPGEGLLRLSMDLATGTAGVLLAAGSALHDRPVSLPFLASAEPVP